MNDAERISEVRKLTGLTWKGLAEKIGIASAQTFTDIRSGRHGISVKLANKIIQAFPNIRREWLMFESGPMTTDESDDKIVVYKSVEELEAPRNIHSMERINPGSLFPQAEVALRNNNDSMTEYPLGCILVMRRVMDKTLLIPGCNYLIETSEFSIVRRLQKGSDEAHITLYSTNTATYADGTQIYEPFEIPIDSVRRVFCILGYIFPQSSEIKAL